MAGMPVKFTTTYSDPDGWQNLKYCQFQFRVNTTYNESGGFFVSYNQDTKRLWLRNDAGVWIGNCTPGTNTTIENTDSKLDCRNTTVYGSGNNLNITWSVTFKSRFAGTKNSYLYVKDDQNLTDGWTQKGNWTIK
jgi:hypothetical protein